jgi:hypothetical protein
MRYFGVLAVLVLVLAGAGTASAISVIGDPIDDASWTQQFNESGVGNFDHLQVDMLTGTLENTLTMPAFRGFSVTNKGWKNMTTSSPATVGVAEGIAVNNLNFYVYFNGLKNDWKPASPLTFVFTAWNGGNCMEQALATWNGSSWSFTTQAPSEKYAAPVPEPVTICGLLLGIGGLVRYTRKRAA